MAYNQNGPGMSSLEVVVLTKPSAPSQPPQNIVIEAISSTVYHKIFYNEVIDYKCKIFQFRRLILDGNIHQNPVKMAL